MQYIVGFIVAFFIALTGVGAGTITVPLLMLFLRVPTASAISVGLIFSTVIKLFLVPVQIVRHNVACHALRLMLLGGVPGVIVGSLLLNRLVASSAETLLNGILGVILISTATLHLYYSFSTLKPNGSMRDRSLFLPWLLFPVGVEVGLSSAGAGALGSTVLLGLTPLQPAQVIGTDLVFGFLLSFLGSVLHWFSYKIPVALLSQMIAGGIAGAATGTALSARIPGKPLRLVLWAWLLILGSQFLLSSCRIWISVH